jgi:hypothetical protein
MYTFDIVRDYVAGIHDVIGEFDGTPGLEIVAEGRTRLYVYDAATGVLESESPDVGNLPFGRATLRPVDADGDGRQEIMAYSNEAWGPSQNRRHVTLFGWNPAVGSLDVRWTVSVADVTNDRVAFVDDSVCDLDGDGRLEVVFGLFTAATGTWTTEIRDAESGSLLDSIINHRFEGVVPVPDADPLIFTHDSGQPLLAYRYARGGSVAPVVALGDVSLAMCRAQAAVTTESERLTPCRIRLGGHDGAGLVVASVDADTDRVTEIAAIDLTQAFTEVGRFAPQRGFISAVAVSPAGPVALGVAVTSGIVLPLDDQLRPLLPSDDAAYRGILFGTQFAASDVVSYPLVAARTDAVTAERLLVIAGGGEARFLDVSEGAYLAGGIEPRWTAGGVERALIADLTDVEGDLQLALVFEPARGVRAL